eukprot:CAMPEP_0168231114 /NCGR_PEP_ID=MMETSP0140_2-20121125/16405_1 /TAXON_ID=44445 /ORGANISM="Pseudo-nitzschia australis, Strain 10249 10 AB" /LENGTH=91 /DNA_ID=CAMNT_0008163509 /DNA_START=948 /DNA_END=1223 /DNA_ORIENTATION=+
MSLEPSILQLLITLCLKRILEMIIGLVPPMEYRWAALMGPKCRLLPLASLLSPNYQKQLVDATSLKTSTSLSSLCPNFAKQDVRLTSAKQR